MSSVSLAAHVGRAGVIGGLHGAAERLRLRVAGERLGITGSKRLSSRASQPRIYTGREDNIFWRRIPGQSGGKVEAAGARALSEKEAAALGPNVIHS